MFTPDQLYSLKSILIFTAAMVSDAQDDDDGYYPMKLACEELLGIVQAEIRAE